MFKKLISILKEHPRKIVFTEGTDPRILEASARLLSGTFLTPILLGNEDEVRAAAEDAGFNIRGAVIIDPEKYENMEAMVAKMVELRKGKMTEDECRAMLKKGNYFGTMLVAMGEADALLGGATYSTADTVRPALQLVKTKPGNKIVSSCFILVRPSATGDNDVLAMGDCAINIKPNEDELVEIAVETAKCARIFGVDPKVAFLSYSTFGSGKGEDVDKMRNACEKTKAAMPDVPVDGEMQFDAAVSPRVAQTKCPDSKVAGYANTFIFPDINAGNIGYKIAQRLGSFEAYGPILLGLNAPINDLSRGCNAQEVYSMANIPAALAANCAFPANFLGGPPLGARFALASRPWNRPRGPNKGVPRPSPAAAGRVGRGGARERAQFSPSGGNGDKRTLRRRWGAPNGAYKRFVRRTKPWRKGGFAALSI